MTRKPDSVEMAVLQEWSTKEDMERQIVPRHEPLTLHFIKGNLSTSGVQRTGFTSSSGTPSSTQIFTVSTATLDWPGLDGFLTHDAEFGLTCGLRATSTAATAGTTLAFRWELKNSTGTTWQAISTYKKVKAGTSTDVERTMSGYYNVATGYNKLPLHIRLRAYARGKGKLRVKNSCYVAFKAKKSS